MEDRTRRASVVIRVEVRESVESINISIEFRIAAISSEC